MYTGKNHFHVTELVSLDVLIWGRENPGSFPTSVFNH